MSLTATEHARAVAPPARRATAHEARTQLEWLAGGLLVAFAVPFLLADVLGLPRDLYYGIYVLAVAGLFGAWLRTRPDPRAVLLRRWGWGVALGLVAAALLALMVIRTEDATSRPGGIELAGAVLWRGILYGTADGVLLSVFPILVVVTAFGGLHGSTARRTLVLASALAASLVFTAVYHAGYGEFRSAKVRKPVAGDVVWSAPTLATLSPFGAPVAHVGMHVAAVLHSYDTEVFLPPHAGGG